MTLVEFMYFLIGAAAGTVAGAAGLAVWLHSADRGAHR